MLDVSSIPNVCDIAFPWKTSPIHVPASKIILICISPYSDIVIHVDSSIIRDINIQLVPLLNNGDHFSRGSSGYDDIVVENDSIGEELEETNSTTHPLPLKTPSPHLQLYERVHIHVQSDRS